MAKPRAIVMNPADNTATVVDTIEPGSTVQLAIGGQISSMLVTEKIPFGHKFALSDIPNGSRIVKYAETIGIATKDIKAGQHVHVHNLESGRGRGDR